MNFAADELNEFKKVFLSVFDHNSENIFSRFVFGFLNFIEGIESNVDVKKNEGFVLLKSSADGFCFPASRIVYFTEKRKQEILFEICDELAKNTSIDNVFEEIIKRPITDKMRLFLEYSFYEKFQDRLYKLFNEKEKKFFSEVEKKLTDRTLQQYRSVYYNILNKKYLFIFFISSFAIILTSAVNYASSGQTYLPYMITSGFIGFLSSIFVILNNPSFVLMNQDFLKLERGLCALYITYSVFINKSFDPASLADEFYTKGPFSYSLRKYYLRKIRCNDEETFSQLFLKEAKNAANNF